MSFTELYKKAKISYHNGDYDICEKTLLEIMNNQEEKPFVMYNLSILYASLNRYDWQNYFNLALEEKPDLLDLITDDQSILKPCPEVDRKLKESSSDDLICEEVEIV